MAELERNEFRSFYMVNASIDNPLIALAGEPNAKQRIFDYMTRNMGMWNTIVLKQSTAAKELKISTVHFCRVIKELERLRYIAKNGKNQTNNIYMINPAKVWKGEAKDHAAGIVKFSKLIQGKTNSEK